MYVLYRTHNTIKYCKNNVKSHVTAYYNDRIAVRDSQPEAVAVPPEIEAQIKDYRHSGQFYPGKMYRLRPKYSQDAKKDEENYCRKEYHDPKKKMGYLEIIRCLNHRFALGFHQGETESINDIFSVVYQYWHEAPKVIVSDYHCVGAVYQANREPDYFKPTVNMVDAFHSRGHSKCSSGIHAQQFKSTHPEHAIMNDSGLEANKSVFYFLFFFFTIFFHLFLQTFKKTNQQPTTKKISTINRRGAGKCYFKSYSLRCCIYEIINVYGYGQINVVHR